MKKTIGIFAHVDSGKTTFSERILYKTGAVKSFGRTDKKNSSLDTDSIERERGITVFSHQAEFVYNDNIYYLTDNPGHTDFFPEAERTLGILDFAVLIISRSVRSDTAELFNVINKNKIPCFIFINKSDAEGFDKHKIFEDIKNRLGEDCFIFEGYENAAEFCAERDEAFFEKYIEDNFKTEDIIYVLKKLIKERKAYPVFYGSALKDEGIDEFLVKFDELTETKYNEKEKFKGKIFKIRHDKDGKTICYIKALKDSVSIKDEFNFNGNIEKINEIRFYNGEKFRNSDIAKAGDVFAVCGLKTPDCGDVITNEGIEEKKIRSSSVMEAEVNINDGSDKNKVASLLKIIEKEEPSLNLNTEDDSININITGKIQLEILKQMFKDRFDVSIDFNKPKVKYAETIKESVMGIGHYEPLRHYAEVQLRLEPLPLNTGIEFKSECHVDKLAINYQNLIKTHVFEKQHRGVLTGSPVTDIRIVLTDGKAHLKHTEGGDFREAVYRGIRQGLMNAKSILLEPFYSFEIYAPKEYTGRIISDIQKLRGSFEPIENINGYVIIKGRGPVDTFMEYQTELMIFTKGRGSISFAYDGYDKCNIAEEIIAEKSYDPMADVKNTPNSVFCKKGAGFNVSWNEVYDYAHTLKK